MVRESGQVNQRWNKANVRRLGGRRKGFLLGKWKRRPLQIYLSIARNIRVGIHIFAFSHRCSHGTACQSPDHGIHGSSDGHDANFNKYPRYRGNAHTMLFRHDSRPCWMILVPDNWIVYNCIGLALRIFNVGQYLCEIVTGIGKGTITFIKRKEWRISYELRSFWLLDI